jgi:hypothetical protein
MADASRDGNGTFVRTYDWTDDAANSIPITASRFDEEMDGVASELTNSMALDGQSTMTADMNLGTNKILALKAATLLTDGVNARQISDNTFKYLGTTAGTSSAYTLTPSTAINDYATGQEFSFTANADNTLDTGETTINISAKGAKNFKKLDASGAKIAVAAGDIKSSITYGIRYDGTDMLLTDQSLQDAPTSATTTSEGIVELATDSELKTGTDSSRAVTPANIKNALGFSDNFESSEQTITISGTISLAHGLGRVPNNWEFFVICKSAELGFSVGDVSKVNQNANTTSGAGRGVLATPNSSNMNIKYTNNVPYVYRKDNGVNAAITAGSWKLIVKAWG